MQATLWPGQRQVHSQLFHVVSWVLLLEQERYQFLLQLYGLFPRELFWLAWARQIYLYETQYPPWAGTEDVNAVRQQDCFTHIVCDEEDACMEILPEVEQPHL